jgi:prepilin-type N-terminal cleavage/methylation domain-containing protein
VAVLAVPLLHGGLMFQRFLRQGGFSLTELMLTVAVAATIMGMGVPVMMDVTASIKVNEAARAIERELQDARLKAVSTNRPLRVRTNCPAAGLLRTVEVLNDSRDSASNRCQTNGDYPFPSDPDGELSTRPNADGPVRAIPNAAAVPTVAYQFHPDGTVLVVVSNTPTVISTEQTVTITRANKSRSVKINGAGKIQLQ